MGYFDGMVSAAFKETAEGTVFYPAGVLGKGRIAPNAAEADAMRTAMKRYYVVSIVLIALVGGSFGGLGGVIPLVWRLAGLAAAVAIPLAWFYLVLMPRVRHWPVAAQGLTLSEAQRASGRAFGRPTLVGLIVLSLVLLAASVFTVFSAPDPTNWWLALLGIVLFGACVVQFSVMLARLR
jgi:hypothetical protein